MNSEQEDISQYPRFISYARAEKQLMNNGFRFLVGDNRRPDVTIVFDNINTGHRAFVKRMNVSNWQIFTYKIN